MPELSSACRSTGPNATSPPAPASLFEQTLDDIEYIFVDDGSPTAASPACWRWPKHTPPAPADPHHHPPCQPGLRRRAQHLSRSGDGHSSAGATATTASSPRCTAASWSGPAKRGPTWSGATSPAMRSPAGSSFPTAQSAFRARSTWKLFLLKRFPGDDQQAHPARSLPAPRHPLSRGVRHDGGHDGAGPGAATRTASTTCRSASTTTSGARAASPSRLDSRGILRNVPDVARFCTEQWAGDADIIRCVHWYEQRHKYHLVSRGGITPGSVPGVWRDASGMRETLANPTIPAYGRLVCLALTTASRCRSASSSAWRRWAPRRLTAAGPGKAAGPGRAAGSRKVCGAKAPDPKARKLRGPANTDHKR